MEAQLYSLPALKYDTNALEPVLSKTLVEVHHSKHHQTYVNNLNLTYEKIVDAQKTNDVKKIAELQGALRFNLGGHLNHSLYWEILAPTSTGGGVLPAESSAFAVEVKRIWGSFENLIAEFNKRTVAIQGSGWGWLGYDAFNKSLKMFETANQDLPELLGVTPILTIDVWEHAYYIDYQNLRLKYLENIWKIVNWAEVEKRYNAAVGSK